ncbi:MAG TPA: methyltransferase [Mesotoga infera]|uniref:Methyltransferase n=1 Tax=Mesotoga infera TaxID=1236046 RepID=A0A7C1CW67_9BACT|nr:methyltransferase [Mesotoga infera]
MGRITHKGIMEVEGNGIPEKDKARQLVLARINELTSGDPDIYLNIDSLAGELNMMRYELFDILNFLQGEGLVRILSKMSVAIADRE